LQTAFPSGLSDNSHYHISLEAGFSFTPLSTIIDHVKYLHAKDRPTQLGVKQQLSPLKSPNEAWSAFYLANPIFGFISQSLYAIIFQWENEASFMSRL
jgi:hypothetical protein